jgi:hypothetical protein
MFAPSKGDFVFAASAPWISVRRNLVQELCQVLLSAHIAGLSVREEDGNSSTRFFAMVLWVSVDVSL